MIAGALKHIFMLSGCLQMTFLWQHTRRFTFLILKWGMKTQFNGDQGVRIWKLVTCDHYTWYMWWKSVIRDFGGEQIIHTNSSPSEIMISVMSLFGWYKQGHEGGILLVMVDSLYMIYVWSKGSPNLFFCSFSMIHLNSAWESVPVYVLLSLAG